MKRKTPVSTKRWYRPAAGGAAYGGLRQVLAEEEDGAGFGTFSSREAARHAKWRMRVPWHPCRTVVAAS
ncbi:MAG: hypothetical protein ACLUE8_02560 [Lachnospiraceae bacterium]